MDRQDVELGMPWWVRVPSSSVQFNDMVGSARWQLLELFAMHDGRKTIGTWLPINAAGKCTTDHISMAGSRQCCRAHLGNSSNITTVGTLIALKAEFEVVSNNSLGAVTPCQPAQVRCRRWVLHRCVGPRTVGGIRPGQAVMQPCQLGMRALLEHCFVRICRADQKKQGASAFTFSNVADHYKIRADASSKFVGFTSAMPAPQRGHVAQPIQWQHHGLQIEWYKTGSASNISRAPEHGVNFFWDP